MQVGNGMESSTDVGPVISQQSLERICDLVQSGVDEGADLLLDGRGVTVPGCEKGVHVPHAAQCCRRLTAFSRALHLLVCARSRVGALV
jgi:hypothetical protein